MVKGKYIWLLVRKEFMLEFRNKVSISAMLLYVVSTIFICYQSFRQVGDKPMWIALLWIIILFSAINAVNKSFSRENKEQQMFFYQLTSPQNIILAKILYNLILINVLTLITYSVYSLVLGMPGNFTFQFLLVLLMGASGISSTITLISGIASKTNNNLGLISILSFPLLVPVILTTIRAGKNALDDIALNMNMKYLASLAGLDILVIVLAFILFPYLWRE